MGDLFASGGSSGYPAALDTATTQTDATPTLSFDATAARASKVNNLATALINIQTELGVDPAGAYADVVTRLDAIGGGVGENLLINGDFRVAQRGTSYTSATTIVNNDDTYILDRWILLADGADTCDVSQNTTTVPTGSYASILLDVETANRKFGILQVLEARDSARAIGGNVSLSFKARVTGTSIANLRAAILSWSSTADAVTSDVVSAWGAAGTDPTLAANWTYENTPSNLAVNTGYQTFSITNIAVDTASTTNVAVFIWVDDTDATVADFVHITDVKLEVGTAVTSFVHRSFVGELVRCQRYCWAYAPGAVTLTFGMGFATGATNFQSFTPLSVEMFAVPTLTVSAAADFDVSDGSGSMISCSGSAIGGRASRRFAQINWTVAAGLTAGQGGRLDVDGAATTAHLILSAEL